MKQYKVGDTIYVKGKITDVDHNETMLPYCVVSSPNYHFWASQESVIGELPTSEPVKPALPKDVADEMEEYKTTGFDLIDYFSAINECADDVKNSSKYVYDNTDEINDQRVTNLANAWNNGYTIAAEPKYYVYIALPYNTDIGGKYYDNDGDFYDCGQLWRNSTDRLCSRAAVQAKLYTADRYQFTKEEIDQLRKDYPAIEIKEVNIDD